MHANPERSLGSSLVCAALLGHRWKAVRGEHHDVGWLCQCVRCGVERYDVELASFDAMNAHLRLEREISQELADEKRATARAYRKATR